MARDKSHVVAGVDLKLRKALEAKMKLEKDRLRKLEEKKQKEEERKKNAEEVAANRRKREEIERKEREEKRKKRLEEVRKQQKEIEERLRSEMEGKEQRHKVLVEYERNRRAIEEEAKKQRRIEKEKEAAERRRLIEAATKSNKFASNDAKHMEEVHQHKEKTLHVQKEHAEKVLSITNSCEKGSQETEGQSMLDSGNISYEISSYEGSEEDNDYDLSPVKVIPSWTRKENLIPHIISQQYIDPDEIFYGTKTFNLNEVFESEGSNERDFKRRSFSGEWLNDCLTEEEENLYKLQMGYI